MRWHHQFHHTLWGRPHLAHRSDRYFKAVRELARNFTRDRQHYQGVRWPKVQIFTPRHPCPHSRSPALQMVGPPEHMTWARPGKNTSPFYWFDGPSGAGPWILWQQPHLLSFSEMAYRGNPTQGTLALHNETVHDTAAFMADFVLQAPPGKDGCFHLGAPMYTAEIESNDGLPATATKDGTFELVYWRWGLSVANKWRERLGLPADPRWVQAERGLCKPLPQRINGTGAEIYYPYSSNYSSIQGHGTVPQLFAHALVPGGAHGVNETVMRETLRQARRGLDIDRLPWCSDPPLYAMAAARLGEVGLASEFLLQPNGTAGTMEYLRSGNCQIKGFLPVYTPGNGALLSAVAMLVGGWDGDGGKAVPGLPQDGWNVRAEGFAKMF
jgi:hypothetical protein